jgi:formiminotetrahydrofolate cyclodeaminase
MPLPVRERTIGDYLDALASNTPTPGGGSAAGVIAALSICLGRMVIILSEPTDELTAANERLTEAAEQAIAGSDADERAYGSYIAASKLPKSTPEEKATRRQAMQTALRDAAETPMHLAELVASIRPTLQAVTEIGNPHVVSDGAIGLILADAAIAMCLINVRVNIPYLKDADLVASLESRMERLR